MCCAKMGTIFKGGERNFIMRHFHIPSKLALTVPLGSRA